MDWLISLQRWLYGGMAEGMRSSADLTGVAPLMAAAFVFGSVHALMPGHGKSVLVSYHLGRESRILDGVITGTMLSLTHVGIAAVLVMAGVAVLSRSLGDAGRAPAFEAMSAGLIAAIGLYLIFRTMRPREHRHAEDGRTLAIATGLVPCPLTTFILTYAIMHDKLAVGLAAVAAMLLGIITTITAFSVGAVVARGRIVSVLNTTERLQERLGFVLELTGALAVFAIGIVMLWDRLGRL